MMRDIWRSAWQGIARRRLRTGLTVGGIAVGAALVMLIASIGAMGERAVGAELQSMGIDGLSLSAEHGLTAECLSAVRTLDEVERAMPLQLRTGRASFANGRDEDVVCCGIDAGADQVISLSLLHGRLLSAGDVAGGRAVCVVDEALAQAVYGRTAVVGKTLTAAPDAGESIELTIVGVTAAGSSLLRSVTAMIPYMLYLPYTTMHTVCGSEAFDQIAVRLMPGTDAGAAEAAIRRAVARTGDTVGELSTEDLAAQKQRLDGLVRILSAVLTAIGGVSLLVSGLGVMTLMLSSVHERTREIGIKKALGATRGRIMAEFLAGAVLLALCGAAAGIAVGAAAGAVGCAVLGIAPAFGARAALTVGGLTLLLGAVSGAYPAYQAAGLRPVDALRAE